MNNQDVNYGETYGYSGHVDLMGRKLDCHFCAQRKNTLICSVLKEFYNADNPRNGDLCGECPFFKTEEEFWDGFRKGRGRI